MSKLARQCGFSAVEVLIALVVVGAIGGTGYLAYTRMKTAGSAPSAADQTQKAAVPAVSTVNKASDLDSAAKVLDTTNVDATATDTSDLDAQVKNF